MKHNTRFNPTTNGALHLGHVYSLIVNEKFAHANGGEFTIRFDNDSPPVLALPKSRQEEILSNQFDDIEWLKIPVDRWQKQTDLLPEVHVELERLHFRFMNDSPEGTHVLPVSIRMLGTNWLPYPYVPQQTAERVVMDHMLGATHLIRGEEFMTEFALYRYFCELFHFDVPEFIFLPRLTSKEGDISKHCGGYTIAEFRGRGYSPDDVKNMLADACLYWSANGWEFHNMKPNPQINV